MTETVVTSTDEGICTITLNRPERLNAINMDLLTNLRVALLDANRDETVHAIILNGEGRAFCSGDDLREFRDQSASEKTARAFIDKLQNITRIIVNGDKVVIGAVHGWAVGGGLEWALNCDFLIMAEGTHCRFPETSWGMTITGGASTILPHAVGLPRARELIMFGEEFTAREGLDMGLVSRVVTVDMMMDEARGLAGRIAALPPGAVNATKRVLNRACYAPMENALKLEADAAVAAFLDPETSVRVAEFRKKSD